MGRTGVELAGDIDTVRGVGGGRGDRVGINDEGSWGASMKAAPTKGQAEATKSG